MNKYLILVNKQFPLEKEIEDELITVPKEFSTGNYKLNKKAFNEFLKLKKEANKIGVDLLIDGGYRSFKYQIDLYEKFKKEKGKKYADKIVAKVKTSEHHTGLAIDLTLKINDKILEENDELFEKEKLFKKIEPLLSKYGFILRYKEGKEKITGYPYEPWHIRYIGKKYALDMQRKNINTLEEYIYPDIYKEKINK